MSDFDWLIEASRKRAYGSVAFHRGDKELRGKLKSVKREGKKIIIDFVWLAERSATPATSPWIRSMQQYEAINERDSLCHSYLMDGNVRIIRSDKTEIRIYAVKKAVPKENNIVPLTDEELRLEWAQYLNVPYTTTWHQLLLCMHNRQKRLQIV